MADLAVANALYNNAVINGNVAAQIWWTKARMRWSETLGHQYLDEHGRCPKSASKLRPRSSSKKQNRLNKKRESGRVDVLGPESETGLCPCHGATNPKVNVPKGVNARHAKRSATR